MVSKKQGHNLDCCRLIPTVPVYNPKFLKALSSV